MCWNVVCFVRLITLLTEITQHSCIWNWQQGTATVGKQVAQGDGGVVKCIWKYRKNARKAGSWRARNWTTFKWAKKFVALKLRVLGYPPPPPLISSIYLSPRGSLINLPWILFPLTEHIKWQVLVLCCAYLFLRFYTFPLQLQGILIIFVQAGRQAGSQSALAFSASGQLNPGFWAIELRTISGG